MFRDLSREGVVVVFALGVFGSVRTTSAQTLLEYSAEARFQLDLHVPEAAVTAMLPPGFTLNVATQGPAKDCNLRRFSWTG